MTAPRRIRLDHVGVVFCHLEHGRDPITLRAGDTVPSGYDVSADLLAAAGDTLPEPVPAAPAAVTAAVQDRGPQAGTTRAKTRRARPGDRQEQPS